MFWRSVVGKLAITILLLVSFVLFVLTISLLQFFKDFHIQEAEKDMLLTAEKVSELVEQHGNEHIVLELTEAIKDPSSKIVYYFKDGTTWLSKTTNEDLKDVSDVLPINDSDLMSVLKTHDALKKQTVMETNN